MNMKSGTSISVEDYLKSDNNFDELYPEHIQQISKRHWTPVEIGKLVIGFLGSDNTKILDIGSGVGKFCLTAGYYAPHVKVVGIEQRKYLIGHAMRAQKKLGLKNVSFVNKNFVQANLHEYEHFYFFNAFYENLDSVDRIDETIDYSEALYEYYVRYLYKGLQEMPAGTRLATFHTFGDEIPRGYKLIEKHANDDLKFWLKQ